MTDNHVYFPSSLLKRFILAYKENRCLWDRNSPLYKNRKLKHSAIAALTELVKEYDSSATKIHVLRKIESLRACVRREHNKVKESYLKAQRPEDIHKPSLWYYDLFSFVREEDPTMKLPKTETEECSENDEAEEVEDEDEKSNYSESEANNFEDIELVQQNENSHTISPAPKIVEISMASHSRSMGEVDQIYKMQKKEVDDEYDAIGLIVASKLRGLQPSMRIIAEKLINDVLYQAQTNELNSCSKIVTADPFKSF